MGRPFARSDVFLFYYGREASRMMLPWHRGPLGVSTDDTVPAAGAQRGTMSKN